MPKCWCEHTAEGGPSTHRCAVHLSTCKHSTLRDTTAVRPRKRKLRKVIGTRRVVEVDEGRPRE